MAHPDARTLEIFRAVAATGSATRAAEKLNTTQPNVTRAIGAFEKQCGFPLFDRGRYGMTPTPAGRQLLAVVERNWAGLRTIAQAIGELRTGPPGTLRASAIPALAEGALGALLGEYANDRPHIGIHLKIGSQEMVVNDVLMGSIDLGMIVGPPPPGSGLHLLPAGKSRMSALVGKDHRLANRRSVHFSELHGEEFVQMLNPHHVRFAADAMGANLAVRPSRVHEVSTQRTMIQLVQRTNAVGFADLDVLGDWPDTIVAIALEPATSWPINLVYGGNRPHSTMLDAFLEWLAARADRSVPVQDPPSVRDEAGMG